MSDLKIKIKISTNEIAISHVQKKNSVTLLLTSEVGLGFRGGKWLYAGELFIQESEFTL